MEFTWVDEVKEKADLVVVVEKYSTLKRSGSSLRGPCPLHQGKDPNFSIFGDRAHYKCFVCGKSGDVFNFIMEKEGLDFMGAARMLADMFGVEVVERKRENPEWQARKQRQKEALSNAKKAARGGGGWGELGLDHLIEKRGLGLEEVEGKRLLLLPLGRGQVAEGWCKYRISDEGEPLLVEVEAIGEVVYQNRFARTAAREGSALFVVDDPITALKLEDSKIGAVSFLVEGKTSWPTEGHAKELAALDPLSVAFLMPLGGETEVRQKRLAQLFESELRLLEQGIEPLVVFPFMKQSELLLDRTLSENVSSWAWIGAIERRSPGSTLSEIWLDHNVVYDTFELRLEQVAARLTRVQDETKRKELMQKLVPVLDTLKDRGHRGLYHAYVAWAAKRLGFRDRYGFLKEIEGSTPLSEAEVF